MGTEDEAQLTVQGRLLAAGGAAVVAATIVNPLDVIKTRIQAQAAAGTSGRSSTTSNLYEQVSRRSFRQYTDVTMTSGSRPSEVVMRRLALACGTPYAPNDVSWHDRKWGICEAPLCIRKPPPGMHTAVAAAPSVNNSMWEMCKAIARKEGIPVLWRGTTASLLIAVPMVGIYMPLYDHLLQQYSPYLAGAAPIAAGTTARTFACFCVAPFELLRTRLQAMEGRKASIKDTIANMVPRQSHSEQQPRGPGAVAHAGGGGVAAAAANGGRAAARSVVSAATSVSHLWTGFPATLVRDVPFSALYWALVEPLRSAMLPKQSHGMWHIQRLHREEQLQQAAASSFEAPPAGATGLGRSSTAGAEAAGGAASSDSSSSSNSQVLGREAPSVRPGRFHHSQDEILLANMVSGFIAGGLAAGATTPFDVVKTRHQIAAKGLGTKSPSVLTTLRKVHAEQGMEGLFAGLKPRAYRAAPACGIVISVYELLKAWLTPE